MIPDLTTLLSLFVAILAGASIAALHLALLRMGLSTFETRQNPGRFVVLMSLVRMLSVGLLLLIVVQQLDPLPLFLFIASFTLARIYLLPKYLPDAKTR